MSFEMGIVKARLKTLVSDSTLSSEEAGLEPLIAGSEDGFSSVGHQKNGVGVEVCSRDIDISSFVEGGFDDSEIRGASCLLKMRETGREGSMLRSCATENSGKLNSADVSSVGVDGLVVEENDPGLDGSEELDDKIVTINVPIAESSENKDNGEEDDFDEEGFEFSVGDFVWSKIKSHPWWPGQIYDPSDASENALKLKQRNRLLVAYFGDGTFSWCHPSQLKPFEECFEEMSRQSNFKSFHNAVQEAVDEIGAIIELKMICSCVSKELCKELDRPLAYNAGIKEGVLVPEGGVLKIPGFLSKPTEILDEMKGIARRISISSLLKLKMLESQLSAFYRFRGCHQMPAYYEPVLISGLEDSLDDNRMDTSKPNIQGPSEEDWLSSPLSQVISGNRQYQRRKQKSIAEIMDSDVGSMATINNLSLKEERKRKRKLKEPPFHTSIGDSVVENGGSRKSPSSCKIKNKKEADSCENEVDEGQEEPESEEGKITGDGIQSDDEQTEKSGLARERKKSKYLSPPFTSLNKGKRKKDIEEESLKVSKEAHVGERMAAAASNIAKSSPILRLDSEIFQKQLPEDIDLEQKTLESIVPETPKQDECETIDLLKVKASSDEVLSELRLVAMGPPHPCPTKSFEIVKDFMSIFRSSIYRNGCYYKVYNRRRPGRKRKLSNLEQGFLGKDLDQRVEPSSDEKKIRKKSKKVKLDEQESVQEPGSLGGRSAESKSKKVDELTELKTNGNTNEVKDSPASIFVTFLPGSSLPSKADLLEIYSKFGILNEVETETFPPNFCARIAFLKISDAEEALKSSQKVNPFGAPDATFRLRYSSQAVKTLELSELPIPETSTQATMQSSAGESSQLQFIRTKLEELNSMVENSDGEVSPYLKSKLQVGMKGLLDQVNTMVVKSSSS